MKQNTFTDSDAGSFGVGMSKISYSEQIGYTEYREKMQEAIELMAAHRERVRKNNPAPREYGKDWAFEVPGIRDPLVVKARSHVPALDELESIFCNVVMHTEHGLETERDAKDRSSCVGTAIICAEGMLELISQHIIELQKLRKELE